MKKDISKSLLHYQDELINGDVQYVYYTLMKYLGELKAKFPRSYATGNISPGYLDYSYFAFYNDYLRSKKLRFGFVLNHQELQFELWLMGQNQAVQEEFWSHLKDSKWNKALKTMPKYSLLEVSLLDVIDFNEKDKMTNTILNNAITLAGEIEKYIRQVN